MGRRAELRIAGSRHGEQPGMDEYSQFERVSEFEWGGGDCGDEPARAATVLPAFDTNDAVMVWALKLREGRAS